MNHMLFYTNYMLGLFFKTLRFKDIELNNIINTINIYEQYNDTGKLMVIDYDENKRLMKYNRFLELTSEVTLIDSALWFRDQHFLLTAFTHKNIKVKNVSKYLSLLQNNLYPYIYHFVKTNRSSDIYIIKELYIHAVGNNIYHEITIYISEDSKMFYTCYHTTC